MPTDTASSPQFTLAMTDVVISAASFAFWRSDRPA
jgi:hypothetical protein